MKADQQNFNLLVMLILNLFILSVGCLVLLVILLFNRKLIAKSSRLYYWIVVSLLIGKLVGYLVYGFKFIFQLAKEDSLCQQLDCDMVRSFELAYKNATLITDLAITELALLLLAAHYKFSCEETLGQVPQWIKVSLKTLKVSIFGGYLVLLVIFNLEENHPYGDIAIGCAVLNLIGVLAYILVQIYLNIKLTGTMTEDSVQHNMKRFTKIMAWVFLGRAIEGAFNILMAINVGDKMLINFIINIKESGDELIMVIVYFCVYLLVTLITEGVTLGLSVTKTTIKLMSEDVYPKSSSWNKNSLYTDAGSDSLNDAINTADNSGEDLEPSVRQFEQIEDVQQRPNSLGTLKKGRFRGRLSLMREIECELSKYLIEQINMDIEEKQQLNLPELLIVRYCIIQHTRLYLISDYCDTSLAEFILQKKSVEQSARVAYRIAVAVNELHRRDMVHGTLKTTNIYFLNKEIKISDYGLLTLKKFMKLTRGYCNKSVYTAPEILAEKSTVVERPTKPADVYALGIIMYQMFTGNSEYRELSLPELDKSFRLNEERPKIPATLPAPLKNLIRNCWQHQAKERPPIENVVLLLKQYCKL